THKVAVRYRAADLPLAFHLFAASELSLGRLFQLKRPGPHRAGGCVDVHRDTRGRGLRTFELQRVRLRAVSEEPVAWPADDWEHEKAYLVDEIMREQCLYQPTASGDLKIRATLALESRHVDGRRVERPRIAPGERRLR